MSSEFLIPRFLNDSHRRACSECKRTFARILREETTWDDLPETVPHVDCRESETLLMMNDEASISRSKLPNVYRAYALSHVILEEAGRTREDPTAQQKVIATAASGLRRFWVALTAMGAGQMILPRLHDPDAHELRFRPYAWAMYQWWDQFRALDGQYINGTLLDLEWPAWFRGLNFFAQYASMEQLQAIVRGEQSAVVAELRKLLPGLTRPDSPSPDSEAHD